MISFGSNHSIFLLPTLLFLILFTFLSSSHGVSSFHHLPNQEMENGYLALRGTERMILEKNSTLILAEEETQRKDPLNNYQYYKGGWDFQSPHYWASVSFSGALLFIIAVTWFVILGLFLCCACICCCCCRQKKSHGYSEKAYAISLTFLILFTIAAITGSVILYVNEEDFHESVADSFTYLVKQGMSIFDNLMSVLSSLTSATTVTVNQVSLPDDLKSSIDIVGQMINATAVIPQATSLATKHSVQVILLPARLTLITLAAVMISIAFFGFLFSILGLQCCIYIFVMLGWVLVTAAFILSGIFLIFSNVVSDTCAAMDDWLENPVSNSTVNEFLPCMDKKTAIETLNISRETTSYLVKITNQYIEGIANKDLPTDAGALHQNLSGPLVPILCNPFNPDMTDRNCSSTEVNFDNAAQEWKKYVCQVSGAGICITQGRLTPETYDQLTSSTNVSYSLYRSGSFLVDLLDCTLVMNTFNGISDDYCPNLRQYSFMTFVGLVTVSTSVMLSLIFWFFYGSERQQRRYARKHIGKAEFHPL